MIETTRDPRALLTGWLADYVDLASGTRFPPSFQALCGILALSTIVGRKAVIKQAGYRLWPPQSIILLGLSGVGKSKSLWLAKQVLRAASDGRPGFVVQQASFFTPAGLMQAWKDVQERDGVGILEGAVIVNEASAILTRKTGNETVSQWMIDVLEHEESAGDFTKSSGSRAVSGLTVAFGMASTVDYLRRSVSVDQFAGGFMHRFLIAHETKRPAAEERHPTAPELAQLADQAAVIADQAPDELEVTAPTRSLVKTISARGEGRSIDSSFLSGFWNRLGASSLKLGGTFALSEGRGTVTPEDVERGEALLANYLYPPVELLVQEMAHGGKKLDLFRLADDLYYIGAKGLSRERLMKRLPASSEKSALELIDFMEASGLLYWNGARTRVWRTAAWRDGAKEMRK